MSKSAGNYNFKGSKMTQSVPTFKVVIVGDSSVGKTFILRKYTGVATANNLVATVGVDMMVKQVRIEGELVKVQLWDTAGSEQYRAITSSYYRGAHGAIIVYDITDKTTFDNVTQWIGNLERWGDENIVQMIIGNKFDLEDKRVVQYSDGNSLANTHDVIFHETSALTGQMIEVAFTELIRKIHQNHEDAKLENENILNSNKESKINLGNKIETSEKKCCL